MAKNRITKTGRPNNTKKMLKSEQIRVLPMAQNRTTESKS